MVRAWIVTSLAAGCTTAGSDTGLRVAANRTNVLSAVVTIDLPGSTTAHVISSSASEVLTSPEVALDATGRGTITVLGLAAETAYSHVAVGDAGTSEPVTVTTARLPDALAGIGMAITPGTGAPPPGYLLVSGNSAAGTYVIAIDGGGTLRWYRGFDVPAIEAKLQPDGTFTTYTGDSAGWQLTEGSYARFRGDGELLASYTAGSDDSEPGSPTVYVDPHELLLTTDAAGDHLHYFGYEARTLEDGARSGVWHELLRQATDGTTELRWKAWEHFDETDSLEAIGDGIYDLDHSNALAIDPASGNYVASFRDLDALVAIDATTGDVLWQLGGKRGQLAFVADTFGGFQGQHSVRVLPDGHLLVYDNGLRHDPPESRAVEYALDLASHTATQVWEFRHQPAVFTPFVGSVERLASGDTLVAFAETGLVDEVDPAGRVVWEGQLVQAATAITAYRIRALPSLYAYQAP